MRAFLKGLDFDKETIDSIMSRHGQLVTGYKEELETVKSTLSELQKVDVNSLQKSIDDYKSKYESEVKAHGDTKTAIANEKSTNAKKALAEAKLAESGANPKAIKFLVKEFDFETLKEDGSNWDELHKPIMEANADFYGAKETKGAAAANPPKGETGHGSTLADLMKEANANPDKLDSILLQVDKLTENQK